MKPDPLDDLIRAAGAELPQAPRADHFTARVLAAAAVTPQASSPELPPRLRWFVRGSGVALGFAMGFAVLLMMPRESARSTNLAPLVAEIAAQPLDPVESYVAQLATLPRSTP